MKITSEKIETSYKGYYPFVEKGLIVEMSKGQKKELIILVRVENLGGKSSLILIKDIFN
jgi:hypothetical protein